MRLEDLAVHKPHPSRGRAYVRRPFVRVQRAGNTRYFAFNVAGSEWFGAHKFAKIVEKEVGGERVLGFVRTNEDVGTFAVSGMERRRSIHATKILRELDLPINRRFLLDEEKLEDGVVMWLGELMPAADEDTPA